MNKLAERPGDLLINCCLEHDSFYAPFKRCLLGPKRGR